MNKIDGISGLRGIVALIIVLYHLQLLRPIENLSPWNWDLYQFVNMFPVVVVVFFILTGLLRSLGYWGSIFHNKKIPDTRTIMIDRWWRIAPTYYVVLIASFCWSVYVLGFYSDLHSDLLVALFSGFTFLNWISPYTFFPAILNGPLWFIGYDMMGYIFTVIMMLGLTRISKKYIVPMILVYGIVFLSLHFLFISLPWPAVSGIASVWFPYYNPFLFALYAIMGMSIGGIIARYGTEQKYLIGDMSFLIVLGSIGYYLWMIRGAPDLAYSYPLSPYRFPIIPLLWAFGILSLIYSRYLGRWFDNRFFLFLASISYSLYLWHGLIIDILKSTIFTHISVNFLEWGIFLCITLMLSLLIAILSVGYLEGFRGKKVKGPKIVT